MWPEEHLGSTCKRYTILQPHDRVFRFFFFFIQNRIRRDIARKGYANVMAIDARRLRSLKVYFHCWPSSCFLIRD